MFDPSEHIIVTILLDTGSEMDESKAANILISETKKPEKEQDTALICKAQRSTFRKRRLTLQTMENLDLVFDQFPFLQIPAYVSCNSSKFTKNWDIHMRCWILQNIQ